jgi:hypothetical protein
MATAELALAIPAVVMVLALCLGALTFSVDQIRCVDAARAAARAASRGEDEVRVRGLAQALIPSGSEVRVSAVGGTDEVRVVVTAPRRMTWLPGLPPASAAATAPREPAAVRP